MIYLGPKRSIETDISKNSSFHDDKSFWPIFPHNKGCDKPQEKTYKGPQARPIYTVDFMRAFFSELRGC